MKSLPVFNPILFLVLVLGVAQLACNFGAQPPNSSPQQPESGTSIPANPSSADQIVVSGVLNKSYTPVNVSIGQFGPVAIRLYMNEDAPSDFSRTGDMLTLDFPSDLQPGTYTFENFMNNPSAKIWATYGTTDGKPANFKGTQGSLILTSVGASFSGQFQISAVDDSDSSRTIEITGSFTNLPFNQ